MLWHLNGNECSGFYSKIFILLHIANGYILFLFKLIVKVNIFVYNKDGDNMEYKFVAKNELDTIEFAQNMESEKFPNMVICLNGDLGSGKTIFTKAFAQAMEVKESVTSPTFSIIKEYRGELPLYHMDVYRLDGHCDGIGIEEYFDKGGVVIIEWADTIKELLPEERIDIHFVVTGEEKRTLVIQAFGRQYEELCEAIL